MPAYKFLEGGGEMGALTRSFNWPATALGAPGTWPQSLKTTLSIILNSKFPMFLFWGPESLCFYNDAYRPSLGQDGKHPGILGRPAAEAWPEIWEFIKPQIDQVLTGGAATWNEDQLLPIYRNGKIEDVYWTFSYSPVVDENGIIAGVFVACSETTAKILAIKDIQSSKEDLDFALNAAELGTWDLDPATYKFKGNTRLKEWFGLQPDDEIPLSFAINAMVESDRERVAKAIERAMQYESGGYYDSEFTIINQKTNKERLVKAVGKAVFNEDHIAYRFSGTLQDITLENTARKAFEDTYQRLEIALDAGKLGSYDLDISSGKMACSHQFKINYGWPEDQSLNFADLVQLIAPEYRDYVEQQISKAIESHHVYHAEYAINWPDGTHHWVKAYGRPIYNQAQEAVRIIGITFDITDQEVAKRELQKATATLEQAIATAHIGTWSANLTNDVLTLSEYSNLIHGVPPGEEITLTQVVNMIIPEHRERIANAIEEIIKNGKSFEEEYCIKPMDGGKMKWLRSTGKAYYDEQCQPINVAGTILDITEPKQDEQRKNDFIGMVSHELKTPLTSLKGYAQILNAKARKQQDEFTIGALGKVETQINKMSDMINGFLNVSRLESGKIQLDKQVFDLDKLISDTIDETILISPSHKIKFEPCDPIMLLADMNKIEHVISNLLSNAIKYSPRGSTIEVKCAIKETTVQVSVHDEGIGIKQQDIDRLFERYYRVESNYIRHISGFGIGLYLSAEIVERHCGKIWVESEIDKGSTFYFTLPLNHDSPVEE